MTTLIYYFLFVFWFKLTLAQGQQKPMATESVTSFLQNLPHMSTLVSILKQNTNLQSYLEGQKNITLFAPNNDASSISHLDNFDLLRYHVLSQSCFDWNECQPIQETSRNGSYVKLSYRDGTKMVDSGMLHSANVIESHQLKPSNVVIHIIDQVLTLPVDLNQTLTQCGWTTARDMFAEASISAIQNITFNSQITLFVPINQAFGTIEPKTLGKDANELLANLLVLNGLKTSDQWRNQTTLETFNHSNNLSIIQNGSDWEVKKSVSLARIVNRDVLFENGVIHTIDQMLWTNNWDRITVPPKTAGAQKNLISVSLHSLVSLSLALCVYCILSC